MAIHRHDNHKSANGFMQWVDDRFPATKVWNEHLAEYWAAKNFNFWYYFGSLAILVLVIQLMTGIFLTMHYKPDAQLAFASVEYIMRDVPFGWLVRYLHSTGASMFFVVVYLHMFRGVIYGSHRQPRELVWLIGCVIFVALMAEAFMGYLLPWGNMSYWGAQVIISLFDVIPYFGPALTEWIRGDFVISDATLNRFFAFHVILMPLILVALVFLHLVALHHVGSNNPDGIDIFENLDEDGKPVDGVPFFPHIVIKDLVGVCGFFIIYLGIVFFWPNLGGIFLEKDNFAPANSLQTPPDIVPLWYFTPFYSILRASTETLLVFFAYSSVVIAVAAAAFTKVSFKLRFAFLVIGAIACVVFLTSSGKAWGVILMGSAIVCFFLLPWLDRSPVLSIRYRSWPFKVALALFLVAFFILGYLGMNAPTPGKTLLAQVCTCIYFAFFILMPWFTSIGKTKPLPDRVTYEAH
ncbi:cytochrome b [Arenicella xantha]|uniref:Cytochrome b n=1 Tax=Arenicella xantha TaxID=644221 RepID=A0A395JNV2_9GAMM|nr:cytochrome bc complex cytochrome b subunit [Arenicella xantha]RBP53331.1 ubiquinol-cytochrome c reductase cytochrome b subunit [Arenicella xantha]